MSIGILNYYDNKRLTLLYEYQHHNKILCVITSFANNAMRSKRDVVVHHHRQTVVDKYIQNEYAIHAEAWKLALFVIQNCVRVKTKIKNSLSSTHHHDI